MGNMRKCILVVDDDADILKIIKDSLTLDGYTVFESGDGKNCLSLFEKHPIDLVVLDLKLPDMDGIQLCRIIRSSSQVPIIMLTARDNISDKVLGLESGADDYLVKPFDYLELAARIRALLRRTSYGVMDQLFEIGNLRVNSVNRVAELNGKKLDLTKKEFDILVLLCMNAGKVLERERIRQELWPDKKLYKWSRTIDVHIQHLRAKIGDDPETCRYIRTVPGVGYILNKENSKVLGFDK